MTDKPSQKSTSQRPKINFDPNDSTLVVGYRLEANDFDGNWYPAKIKDIDWNNREVFVHFEKWNSKFDEWIKMDSSRLRSAHTSNMNKEKVFKKGDKVIAFWNASKKYPAVVKDILANGMYSIQFYDGFEKEVHNSKMWRLTPNEYTSLIRQDCEVGSKQDRRDRKRKHNVADLFKSSVAKKKKPDEKPTKKVQTPEPDTNLEQVIGTVSVAGQDGHIESWKRVLKARKDGVTAGKIEVIIENPSGKRFRSRAEIAKYCEDNQLVYKTEDFDFSAKGKPRIPPKPAVEVPPKPEPPPTEPVVKYAKPSEAIPPSNLILNLSDIPDDVESIIVGGLKVRVENDQLICPEKSCGKHFRKNNLLQMHIKHYHPPLKQYLDFTPSVTDLAYARTAGNLESPSDSNVLPSHTHVPSSPANTNLVSSAEKKPNLNQSRLKAVAKDLTVYTGSKDISSPPQNVSQSEKTRESANKPEMTLSPHRRSHSDAIKRKLVSDKVKVEVVKEEVKTELQQENKVVVEGQKYEKLRANEIIHCLCGIMEEDGLMIQCDICLCWQHAFCIGITPEMDVPEKYICSVCKNPHRGRSAFKYFNDQQWIKTGVLPSLSFRKKNSDKLNERQQLLKRSFELSGMLSLIGKFLHTLRIKISIADQKDHPKLWLWAKKWMENMGYDFVAAEQEMKKDNPDEPKAPEPEKAIDSVECKLNLLDHIIHYQSIVESRLMNIENQVAELESVQDDVMEDESAEKCPRTKATVEMLLKDLNNVNKSTFLIY